ncbi:hypothetical protein, partial [Pseudomonas viridiflava]
LRGDKTAAIETLDKVESTFGWSVWLIQNRLSVAQLWDGIDKKRKLARSYKVAAGENTLVKIIITFVAKRSEGTAVPGFLQSELARMFKDSSEGNIVHPYLKTKLLQLANPDANLIPLTLALEALSDSIDYYETL